LTKDGLKRRVVTTAAVAAAAAVVGTATMIRSILALYLENWVLASFSLLLLSPLVSYTPRGRYY
jgi:hypothetical protein